MKDYVVVLSLHIVLLRWHTLVMLGWVLIYFDLFVYLFRPDVTPHTHLIKKNRS